MAALWLSYDFVLTTSQFMHNGGIADFHLIKRRLQKDLPDTAFDMVQGNTGMALTQCFSVRDLTPFFPLRLRMVLRATTVKGKQIPDTLFPIELTNLKLPDCNARSFTPEILRKAMGDTIATLNSYAEEFNITEVRSVAFFFFASLLLNYVLAELDELLRD